VCLRVRDDGHGMTEEVKRHLFEPFFTTKEPGKGTGLGLSTVFGIVKQSKGEVSVESEDGKGAVFAVFLPYLKDAAARPAAAGQPGAVKRGTEAILLVEDDEMLLRLSTRVLKEGGYAVIPASSGQTALEAMALRGKPVDLLLTDVIMPGMSGRDLARELARRGLVGRTLYMSGYTDDAMLKHGVLEHGIALIHKPFSVETLNAGIRGVLDGPADQARA
jgi:CheY-like chemotaxis protein